MTEHEFAIIYAKLCANYNKNFTNEVIQIKKDMFFNRFSGLPTNVFNGAVSLLMDRHGAGHGYFPAMKEMNECVNIATSKIEYNTINKDCPSCNGTGFVSMLVSFDSDGNIYDRKKWSLDASVSLRNNKDKKYYDTSVCCSCDAGKNNLISGCKYKTNETDFIGEL